VGCSDPAHNRGPTITFWAWLEENDRKNAAFGRVPF
jgi:hypothetical protein